MGSLIGQEEAAVGPSVGRGDDLEVVLEHGGPLLGETDASRQRRVCHCGGALNVSAEGEVSVEEADEFTCIKLI